MPATDPSPAWSRIDPTALGALVIVLASAALSIASARLLGGTVRIRWTVGPSRHYGPEVAATWLVLAAFPVVLAGLWLGAWWLRTRLDCPDGIADVDEYGAIYDWCVLLTLLAIVVGQAVLVVLNL